MDPPQLKIPHPEQMGNQVGFLQEYQVGIVLGHKPNYTIELAF
jgi:hypothetical protein